MTTTRKTNHLAADHYSADAMVQRLRKRRQRRLRRRGQKPEPGLIFALDQHGDEIRVSYSALNETHVSIVGPSGFGKTCLGFSIAIQAMTSPLDHGLVVIDPDGGLTKLTTRWLSDHPEIPPDRIVLIDVNRSDYRPLLNPLQRLPDGRSFGIDAAAKALLAVAGNADFAAMPRLRKYLRASCGALLERGFPLTTLSWFLSLLPQGDRLRTAATQQVSNPFFQLVFDDLRSMDMRTIREVLDSTANRSAGFAEDHRVAEMLCSKVNNVDWDRVLREKMFVLINGGQDGLNPISRDDCRLICALANQGLIEAGFRQPIDSGNHTLVLADEFSEYADDNAAAATARLRKRGAHFLYLHQDITQIESDYPKLWAAIDTNAQIKCFFGGGSRELTERAAKRVYTGELDLERRKHETQQIAFRPVRTMVDVRGVSRGGSDGETWSESQTLGESQSWGATETSGRSSSFTMCFSMEGSQIIPNSWVESYGRQSSVSTRHNRTHSRSSTEGYAYSKTRNWSESLVTVPYTDHEEFRQPASVQFFSLPELWEMKYAELMLLPKRYMVVKVGNEPSRIGRTLDIIAHQPSAEELVAYERTLLERSPYTMPVAEAAQAFRDLLTECGFGQQLKQAGAPTLDDVAPVRGGEECVVRATVVEVRMPAGDSQLDPQPTDVVEGQVIEPANLPDYREPDHYGIEM